MNSRDRELDRRITALEEQVSRLIGNRLDAAARPIWCVETGQRYKSVRFASSQLDISQTQLSNAANHRKNAHTAGGFHWSYEEPLPQVSAMGNAMIIAQGLHAHVTANRVDDSAREKLRKLATVIAAALAMLLIVCMPARASIVYDVSIDTSALPPGQYQAEFYLSNLADNWTTTKQPDSFSIDGDLIRTVSDRNYADQPSVTIAPPMPLNFYVTLNGSPGSSDYFLLAMKMPDGGMLSAPDGSEWLAWAAMDQADPTLNLDLPAQMTIAVVPEPKPKHLAPVPIILWLLFHRHLRRNRRR